MTRRGKGEGSIHQRKDGRWTAVVDLGWDSEGRNRKYVYGKTRQEVSQKLRAATKAHEEGVLVRDERLTVEKFMPLWTDSKKMSLRASTWKRYSGIINLHVLPNLGKLRINKLEAHHLQAVYAKLIKGGLAPSSVLYLHRVMHVALQDAMKWGLVARNVASVVTPPKPHRKKTITLSPLQAQQFLQAASGARLEALYVVGLTTGMRQGELLGLQWGDIDLDKSYLVVQHSLQIAAGGGHEIGPPKTKRSRRRVLLHPLAVRALTDHKERQAKEIVAAMGAWDDQDIVFPNIIGRPITPTNLIRRSFYPLVEHAGLPKLRFHDLRHTAATLLLGQGVHPKIVSEMLGHSQIGITLDLYSHVTETMLQGAVDAFDDILDSGLTTPQELPDGENNE